MFTGFPRRSPIRFEMWSAPLALTKFTVQHVIEVDRTDFHLFVFTIGELHPPPIPRR
jgi:hypothetical protein